MKKRLLSAILALAMLLCLMPMVAFAEPEEMPSISATYINPLYADQVAAEDVEFFYQENELLYSGGNYSSGKTYHTDPAAVAPILREAMEERAASVSFPYQIPKDMWSQAGLTEIALDVLDIALAHTGVPTQGDYLHWHYEHLQFGTGSGIPNGDGTAYNTDITFYMTFYTSAEQEKEVKEGVDALLEELNPSGTDYQKIKTVYDWMCDNIDYDYTNLEDDEYTLKYSAYAALINRTSVCQGYANLLYRLALQMGIDCRVIAGYSEGQSHAWNIVKLGDYYYNLDATWDAGRSTPAYFLRSNANFSNHDRLSDYTTSGFNASYPMSAKDYDPSQDEPKYVASGTCDEDLTWTLDAEGTLTISGTGDMADFHRNATAPWEDWTEDIKTVVIEDGVTYIGSMAFRDCVNLVEVDIADSVTGIGAHVFSKCESLTDLEIPNSVMSMGFGVFEYSGIVNISLSNNLEIIDQGMFNACNGLKSIVIPEGVTSLEKGVFWNCTNLKNVTLPSTLTSIGAEVFYCCPSLTEVVIPDSVIHISDWAFESSGLTSIEIPASVTELWGGTFSGCENLTGIWVHEANPNYSSDASGALLDKQQKTLLRVPGGLSGTYTVPDTVTGIDTHAFVDCAKLTGINLSAGVTDISSGAFSGCSSLLSIAIPSSVTVIGDYTFYNCSSLMSVTLPESVTEIGNAAFDGCDRIWHVLYTGTEDQWNAITIGKNNTDMKKATRHYNAAGDEVIASDRTTCTEKIFCECTICGAGLAEPIEGGTHDMGDWVITDATCTVDGSRKRTCQRAGCDYTETEMIAAPGHKYDAVVTDPTCTTGGYTTYTCSCGASYVSDEKAALNHDMTDWVTTEATCTVDGSKTRTCKRAGCDYSETEVIAAPGHSYVPVVTDPTCTTGGYTTYTCSCGDSYVGDETDALTHDMTDWVTTDATCTVDGSKIRFCRREGCDYTETEVIAAPGHNHVAVVTDPTCTAGGYTTYTCSVCDDSYVADEVPAKGHSHSYVVTTEPTVKTEGVLTGTCAVCGDTVTETIPKLNKAEYAYEVIKEPTDDEPGIGRYILTSEFGQFVFEVALDEASQVKPGDVNGDNQVTVSDLMRLANHFAKGVEIDKANADVNGDGKVTVSDLMRLANYFAGKATLG